MYMRVYVYIYFGDGVADVFVIVWYGTCRGKGYTFTERKVLPVFLLLAQIGSLGIGPDEPIPLKLIHHMSSLVSITVGYSGYNFND